MNRRLLACLVAVASLLSVVRAAQTKHTVFITDAAGRGGAGGEPRASRPTGAAASRPDFMVFFTRHDVKDAKGRIVTGLGCVTWMEGTGVHVAVFTLVPKPGAPNTFLADTREHVASLQPVPFVDFGLKVGESRSLDELKTLGLDPMVVSFK